MKTIFDRLSGGGVRERTLYVVQSETGRQYLGCPSHHKMFDGGGFKFAATKFRAAQEAMKHLEKRGVVVEVINFKTDGGYRVEEDARSHTSLGITAAPVHLDREYTGAHNE